MKLPPGFRLSEFGEVASTNDEAARLVREGASAYTVITAARQTKGRGRYGRDWVSLEGNLFASLILTAAGGPSQRALYGFVMSAAICEALLGYLPYSDPPLLKWPNDVMVGAKKIAGVLLETAQGPRGEMLVVGFGVNCKSHPATLDPPATSLAAEGVEAGVEEILDGILRQFLVLNTQFGEHGFHVIRDRWMALCPHIGQQVAFHFGGREIKGTFADLGEDDGALVVQKSDGEILHLTAGEAYFSDPEKDAGKAPEKA